MSDGGNPARRTFWSTLTWPPREELRIFAAGSIIMFGVGLLYGGPVYGASAAVMMLPLLAAGWALHRVLKAWAEWPSRRRLGSWTKAVVRYLLTDP
jgi:hypothetical protein